MDNRPPLAAVHAAAAVTLVAVCGFGMANKQVPGWERSVFDFFNDLPRPVGRPIESIMWIGTTLGIAVAALVASLLRRQRLSTQLLAAGLLAWVGQRMLKAAVDRGRPKDLLPDANFWGHLASGGGIPSGHTAMAVAVCATIAFRVGLRARVLCAIVALLVGVGRMYTGNHLPLDVVAGAALGWLAAWGAREITQRISPRTAPTQRTLGDFGDPLAQVPQSSGRACGREPGKDRG